MTARLDPGPHATGQTDGEPRDTGHRPDYVIEIWISPQMLARNPDRPLPLWEALEVGKPQNRDAAPGTPASCPSYDTAATCAREVRDLEAEA